MNEWVRKRREHMVRDINTSANRNSGLIMIVLSIVLSVVLVLNGTGLFLRKTRYITVALSLSLVLSILSSLFCMVKRISQRPATKYIICSASMLITFFIYSALPQHTELLLTLPVLITAQYRSRNQYRYAIAGSCIIAVVCPPLSFLMGTWDTSFLLNVTRTGLRAISLTVTGLGAVDPWNYVGPILLYRSLPELFLTVIQCLLLISILRLGDSDINNRLRIIMLSETDAMTGLMNRASFDKRIETYRNDFDKRFSIIFIDANGLHRLNNERGHAEGDRMLCFLADQLRTFFDATSIYRMAGDEFIVLVCDTPEWTLDEHVSSIERACESAGYSISAGIASGTEDSDIYAVIIEAEQRMYAAKTRYYSQSGHDRRKHRHIDETTEEA